MDEIRTTLREIQRDVAEVKLSQVRMEADVAYHIRRTTLAEESIEHLRTDVKPISQHVIMMEGALRLVKIVSLVLGLAAAAWAFFKS